MHLDPLAPDLHASLRLDPYAPRAARFRVREVDSPSPDLRDAVVLLTSEIVSRAVEQCDADGEYAAVELRVWMPSNVVRVELRAPADVLAGEAELGPRHYDLMLLDCIADRWSLDQGSEHSCFWFEIDRRETSPIGRGVSHGGVVSDSGSRAGRA